MDREKLLQQCSNYFKNNGGYNRVLKKIRDKYKSLGKIGGTIKLENLTQNEKDALTGFLGKNFYKNSITIKLERFQNALKDTPYRELSLIEVLNEYFGEEILTKKIEIGIYERDRKNFFNEIIKMFIDTIAYEWLEYTMNSKQNAYRILTQRYDSNKEKLKKDLIIVCKGLNNLPCFEKRNERLALFASKINKDPHTFDERMECGKLLLSGIVYILNEKYPKNAENNAEILYRVGLIKDEMSNFTMFSGLLAYKENEIHKGWEGFYNLYEPMQVSLLNLSSIEKVKSPKGKVFVFENPTVFSEVLHRTIDKQPALMCTYGQVKLASLILLDMLTENGTQIYYSGDFDPEGILIADKLKKRYKEKLTIWRYTKEDYERTVSNKKVSDSRMKKAEKVTDLELINLVGYIKERKYAGYQEMMIDELVNDTYSILST